MRFAWIHDHQNEFEIAMMCQILNVSRSGYYKWKNRPISATESRRAELAEQVREVYDESRQVYGSPRVHRALVARGVSCCENTVAKIMRENKLRSKMMRRFRPTTTDSDHACPVAKNELDRCFDPRAPNVAWVGDITYIPTDEGWLYLAIVMDLYSRRIIGWAMADHLKSSLAIDALTMAIEQRMDEHATLDNLLYHSDRGVQYASASYRAMLEAHGITASMSRRGNCYDNAVAESFMGSLKTELIHHERYTTRQQAMGSVFEYIELFYNRQRLHSSLGYQSPAQFEAA